MFRIDAIARQHAQTAKGQREIGIQLDGALIERDGRGIFAPVLFALPPWRMP